MGSPRKRRLKRAISATLSPSAPFSADLEVKLKDSEFITNLIRYHHLGGGTSCKSALFAHGETPDPDVVDHHLLNSGLAGVSKSSDMDLIGLVRWNISSGGAPNNHSCIKIDDIHFLFTTTQGDGLNGAKVAAEAVDCPADAANGCYLVQLDPVAGAVADGAVGAAFTAAVTAAAADHPRLGKITFTADDVDADVLYVQSSDFSGHSVEEVTDVGDEIEISAIPATQKSHNVPHYYLKLDGGDSADLTADSGILWLQNGPGSKYPNGVDDADAGDPAALKVDIIPGGFVQGKRLMIKIVTGVNAGDQIKIESLDAAHANPAALDNHVGAQLYVASSVPGIMDQAARAALDPAAGTDITLGTVIIPAANDDLGAAAFGGVRVTFDRGAQDLDSVLAGAGMMLHWRVV